MEGGEFLSGIVRKLLGDLARNRIRVRRLLPGQAFFKIGVISGPDGRGIPYVMPAVRLVGMGYVKQWMASTQLIRKIDSKGITAVEKAMGSAFTELGDK